MSASRPTREQEEALERAIAPLRDAFREKLPARVADLAAALAAGRAGDAAQLAEAHHQAHAFQGTAGSYGFDAVSSAALAIEELLEGRLGTPRASAAPAWRELEAALGRLRAAVADARR